MPEKKKLAEVYGVSRGIPLTYVSRMYVDNKFIDNLTRDKHLVVFGGSKQGKTCLRKRCLNDDDYIVVQCNASSTRPIIYEMILKHAGASVTITETKTISGFKKVEVSFEAKGKLPFVAEAGGAVSGGGEKQKSDQTTRTSFEIDPADPNDVIRVLQTVDFSKYIVLEDFHYLPEEVQREIAIDLKAFHEQSSLCFVVVGVWLESNRLVMYNGDLAGRLMPVDADQWKQEDLLKVITDGEPLLNVHFAEDVKDAIITWSQNNVGILQETCYKLCEAAGVLRTMPALTTIGTVEQVKEAVASIAAEHSTRYRNFLENFKEGLQATELQMYKWIAYAVVTADPGQLKRGLKLKDIHRQLNAVHPTHKGRLLQNNVAQALANVGKVQAKYRVQPIIFDFEANEDTLRIADSGFILYVASQPREKLLEIIGCEEVEATVPTPSLKLPYLT